MKNFWRQFFKGSSDQVHTPYAAMALAFLLATPIVTLSCACVIQHVFIMGKGLDGPTVNLLLGMLGAATGGVVSAGVSMFSKTTFSQTIASSVEGNGLPPSSAKAAKMEVF